MDGGKIKVYVASSWRNKKHSVVVELLRSEGFDVYNFKEGSPFGWHEISENWENWTPEEFITALGHPLAESAYSRDMCALAGCHVCILLNPCGVSSHQELAWACGAGKQVYIIVDSGNPPELMYKMAKLCTTIEEAIVDIKDRHNIVRQRSWQDLYCNALRLFELESDFGGTGAKPPNPVAIINSFCLCGDARSYAKLSQKAFELPCLFPDNDGCVAMHWQNTDGEIYATINDKNVLVFVGGNTATDATIKGEEPASGKLIVALYNHIFCPE